MSCFVRPPPFFWSTTSQLIERTQSLLYTRRNHRLAHDPRQDDTKNADVSEAGTATNAITIGTGTYDDWIRSQGSKWKHPDPLGPKWLGGDVPFPRNPSFKPPTPVSDALRMTIYTAHKTNPSVNDFHALSTRYGISIKRVEAIVRLKELEAQWKQSKPLQTGFLVGMERLLGLHPGGRKFSISQEIASSNRTYQNEADEMSLRSSDQGRKRRGISHTFFEPVDEGKETFVPGLLDEQREMTGAVRVQRPQYPTTLVQPDSLKPAYKFVDVGLRWFNPTDAGRRKKESLRRKVIHSGKRATKVLVASRS